MNARFVPPMGEHETDKHYSAVTQLFTNHPALLNHNFLDVKHTHATISETDYLLFIPNISSTSAESASP